MAPPPPTTLPLQERVQRLASTLQFYWFLGHFTLLLSVARYSLSYITFRYYSRWAQVSYRLAFLSAVATYGIVVYKAYRARVKTANRESVMMLLSDENVQYLLISLVWLFVRQVPLALLPFAVYSVFHVATYTRTNVIPTFQPPKAASPTGPTSPNSPRPGASQSAVGNGIGKFVKEYYDASMTLVAALEIACWFRLLFTAITFSKGSWILLSIYTIFLRARISQSQFVQGAFTHGSALVDTQVQNQNVPPAVRQVWEQAKGLSLKVLDATDLRKYIGTQPNAQPGKKWQ